uniref:UBA domain containing 2 n=1 Tax=Astyanax mexicanus TaxID=7994 RepID=A0A8B9JTG9_ASTMX
MTYLFSLSLSLSLSHRLGPVFALFVPFFYSIPRVQVTQLLGYISITNKSLVYIVGLQLLTSSAYMWVVALSGLISGLLYYNNALAVQRFLQVPRWLARCCSLVLEPLFSGTEPRAEAPLGMGATLDIQRQQRMDMLDQQLLLSQLAQFRRNVQQQQQQQGGLLNWNRFFPGLRHRGQNRPHGQPRPQQPPQPHPLDTPVAEEQVARLMEMGFSRVDAQEALRASNNDINMATNFLLQH